MNGYNKINSLEDVEEDPVVRPDFRLNGNNKYSIDRDDFSTGTFTVQQAEHAREILYYF